MKIPFLLVTNLLTISLFSSPEALACSCACWSNAQQASQRPGVITAVVETKISHNDGSALIDVKKVLKGPATTGEIRVLGQDGQNCNGSLVTDTSVPWVLLFSQTDDGYQSVACAESALPLFADGSAEIELGEKARVTREELQRLLDYRLVPSVKGLSCNFGVSRMFVNLDSPEQPEWDLNIFESKSTNKPEDLSLDYQRDLAGNGPRLGKIHASAFVYRLRADEFSINVNLTDPFFATRSATSGIVSMRNSYEAGPLSVTRFTKFDGGNSVEGSPFLSHTTSVECRLNVGLPLVAVE